jgi:hypothetical protein
MTANNSEWMRVDKSFFNILQKRVIRDSMERKYYKKYNPNTPVFKSYKHATGEIAKQLNNKGWF